MKKFFNLCFRIFPDEIGGSKRFIFNLNKYLVKLGNYSYVLTANPINKKNPEYEIIENINIERYNLSTNLSPIAIFKNVIVIFKKIKKINLSQFDYFFFHHPFPSFFFFLIIRKLNKKKYLFFYGPWYKEYLIDLKFRNQRYLFIIPFFMKIIETYIMKKMDKIIVLSEYSKKLCIKNYGIKSEKIIVFSGGVDLEIFKKLDSIKKENDLITFLTIRRLEPRMGLENLIRAFKILQIQNENLYQKIKLIIGGTGSLRNYLEKLVNDLNLTDKIIFLGFILEKNLCEIYNSADFFILPSIAEEGFGMVLPEAISCGCIPIGTNVAAIPEFFRNYSTKFLINGFSSEKIYEKILEILTLSNDEKEKFIELGLKLADQKYNFEKLIKNFLDILDK